jgi:hypothetical protein
MAQVGHVLHDHATVILVTSGIPADQVKRAGLQWAATPQIALDTALAKVGPQARIAVLQGAAEMLPVVNH